MTPRYAILTGVLVMLSIGLGLPLLLMWLEGIIVTRRERRMTLQHDLTRNAVRRCTRHMGSEL